MNKEAFALRRPAPYGLRYKTDLDTATTLAFRPSIHMPRWASRITLEITKVRVERLQDITEEDARAEGMKNYVLGNQGAIPRTARDNYKILWDSLHGKGAWDKNPWVWAIEFCLFPKESSTPVATLKKKKTHASPKCESSRANVENKKK